MRAYRRLLSFLLLAGGSLIAASAQADGGGYGFWPGWWGSLGIASDYYIGNVPTPPYFALHPPVYYGQRVGMPYGNSPLPRPPRPVLREEREFVAAAAPRTPVMGLMILNPYVPPTTDAAREELPAPAKPKKRGRPR